MGWSGGRFQDDSSALVIFVPLALLLLHQIHLRSPGIRTCWGSLVWEILTRTDSNPAVNNAQTLPHQEALGPEQPSCGFCRNLVIRDDPLAADRYVIYTKGEFPTFPLRVGCRGPLPPSTCSQLQFFVEHALGNPEAVGVFCDEKCSSGIKRSWMSNVSSAAQFSSEGKLFVFPRILMKFQFSSSSV